MYCTYPSTTSLTIARSAKSAFSTLSSSSVDEIENGLETVWRRYRKKKGGKQDRSSSSSSSLSAPHQLTKKELNHLEPEVAEILRNAYKRDASLFRSLDATMTLFPPTTTAREGDHAAPLPSQTLATAAFILSDSRTGGRFKRLPCFPLSHNEDEILVLNGGWMANDANMRQTSEASKFAQRSRKGDSEGAVSAAPLEASDEDILSRMEFLAMGSDLKLVR